MTCMQLGGACDKEFTAASFEEIAEMSKQHGGEMFQKRDKPHLEAMEKMMELGKNPKKMMQWFNQKAEEFKSLPEI